MFKNRIRLFLKRGDVFRDSLFSSELPFKNVKPSCNIFVADVFHILGILSTSFKWYLA